MLPPESIRFFFLDKSYIAALLDGAMSLGRSYTIDYQHDCRVIDKVMDRALCESSFIRPSLQKKERKPSEVGKNALSGAVSGFLLRSVMVSGWRGLEFKAFEEGKRQRASACSPAGNAGDRSAAGALCE